eukprot:scaffold121723_cov38-Attheya_sp.AAC.2
MTSRSVIVIGGRASLRSLRVGCSTRKKFHFTTHDSFIHTTRWKSHKTNNNNNTMTTNGVAGRTNYAKWDRVASDLIEEVEEEEKKARVEDKAAVGLDGKYAVSAAQAEERAKSKTVKATQKKLESFQKREQAVVQTLTGLFDDDNKKDPSSSSTTFRVTRKDLEAGKRVVSIGATTGRSWKDTI